MKATRTNHYRSVMTRIGTSIDPQGEMLILLGIDLTQCGEYNFQTNIAII